jgi:hypothetical protein
MSVLLKCPYETVLVSIGLVKLRARMAGPSLKSKFFWCRGSEWKSCSKEREIWILWLEVTRRSSCGTCPDSIGNARGDINIKSLTGRSTKTSKYMLQNTIDNIEVLSIVCLQWRYGPTD